MTKAKLLAELSTNLEPEVVPVLAAIDEVIIPFLFPVGGFVPWPTNTAPSGWLMCDGAAVSRTTFADLFAVIGTSFGVGDGATTFNVPDGRGRSLVGRDPGQAEFDTIGETGGSKTHTHAGHAAHNVTQPSGHSDHNVTQPGGHAAHNVTQPSAHSALGTHAHELPIIKLSGGTGAFRTLASTVFGTGTSRAPVSSQTPGANTTAGPVSLSEAVSGGTPSAHAGTAVDAHSAHTGTAVNAHSAHSGAAVDAHSAHDTPTALSPYLVTGGWIIKT